MTRSSALACAALLLLGCSADDEPTADPAPAPPRVQQPEPKPALRPVTCPTTAGNCRTASGRVLYVEAVDPDGDGDAHFVLLSRQSITAPGLSVIDVSKRLRPDPLPRRGDTVIAAGPVYRGSRNQRQIEAIELSVARR